MSRRDNMIEASWFVEDGFVNNGTHILQIDLDWFGFVNDENPDLNEVGVVLDEILEEEFNNRVYPHFENRDALIAEVLEALKKRREDKE